ncbi:MAG: ornithine carbamoyltransferase [Elusimicrobiota bacterium]|jgi:ornithine carbamoyltransferase|nr:ornithine carbamoyltransferase [Elusimicrobiota bacterium]
MRGKDLLSIGDLSFAEVELILDKATQLKKLYKEGVQCEIMRDKTLAMIFHKASTRTRVSFEAGFAQMGGHAIYLDNQSTQMGRGEPIEDTARVLSRYVDLIMIRTFKQEMVEQLAKYSTVPVINGLTDSSHPCQALADIFTAYEKFKNLRQRKFVFIGDGNNVANSLMMVCAKVGMDMVVCCPKGYFPDEKIIAAAQAVAKVVGSKIELESDVNIAAKNADVLYTDVWASMGQEDQAQKRKQDLKNYKIDAQVLELANKDCIVMHCLPAHRGEEISGDVFEGEHSVIFDEAENRLHVQKAVMALLIGDK